MAVKWNCDVCGKQTDLNPPTELVTDWAGSPKTVKFENMDPQTGEVKMYEVPMQKDLSPRAHLIRLNAGQQSIQRDFCEECLKGVPEIKALWEALKKVDRK